MDKRGIERAVGKSFVSAHENDPEGMGIQYNEIGILRYQYVFGKGFMSSGGEQAMQEQAHYMNIKEGFRVLVIGSGLGGECQWIARQCKNVKVFGVDILTSAVLMSKQNYPSCAIELKYDRAAMDRINHFLATPADTNCGETNVVYGAGDILRLALPDKSIDLVFSRDSLLHLTEENKVLCMKLCKRWLKPSGRFFLTDYCLDRPENYDDEIKAYLNTRPYHLCTLDHYQTLIKQAGMNILMAKDNKAEWVLHLQRELDFLQRNKDEFIAKFSVSDYNDLVEGWTAKLARSHKGMQMWALFLMEPIR